MRIAFIVFERLTTLDLIGAYDPITRLRSMGFHPDLAWDLCAIAPGAVRDDRGLVLQPTASPPSLADYDVLVAPGGYGTQALVDDAAFLDWLRTAQGVALRASVCTGALLFGAAGWLRGRRATTHPSWTLELARYGAIATEERVVDTGDVITAGGVTAALDLGLHVVERLAGPEVRERIQRQMDYPGAAGGAPRFVPTLPAADS